MAFISNNSFGEIKGNLGNYNFRVFNGKTQIRQRPVKFKMSYSEKAISLRKRFKTNALFSKSVSGLPDLKQIWKKYEPKSTSAFNNICKYNFHKVCDEFPTIDNIITPDGFDLSVANIGMTKKELNLKFKFPENVEPYIKTGASLSINMIVVSKEPFDKKENLFDVVSQVKEESLFNSGKTLNTCIEFEKRNQSSFEKYRYHIVFTAIVLKSNEDKILLNSKTYTKLF